MICWDNDGIILGYWWIYPLVICYIAIENTTFIVFHSWFTYSKWLVMTNSLLLKMAHWNRWFTHQQWWFSIVMLVYPLVFFVTVCYSKWQTEMDLPIKNAWWFSVVCLPEATINFHGFNGKHEVLFRKFGTCSKIFSDILWYFKWELMMKTMKDLPLFTQQLHGDTPEKRPAVWYM